MFHLPIPYCIRNTSIIHQSGNSPIIWADIKKELKNIQDHLHLRD